MTDPVGAMGVVARWRRLPVAVRDLPFAVLLAVGSVLPALAGHGTEVGGLPDRPPDALTVVAVVLQAAPLAIRRRWPMIALALVVAGFCLDQLRGYHTFAGLALPLILLSSGLHVACHRLMVCIALTVGHVAFAASLRQVGGSETAVELVTFYLALVLAWGAGAWLRSARAAEVVRRRHEAEAARVTERVRLARDLHDVVTHHVTAMIVQTEAARYLAGAPERQDEALAAVAETGRRSLTDLRHLLDVLNPDHEPAPDHPRRDVRGVVEETRQAGQPVELVESGEAVLGTDVEDVVYRVVQEGLTNGLKHARGAHTVVHIAHARDAVTVEVRTAGAGTPAATPGSRRGLRGLRARVADLGGSFEAGPWEDGGFAVRARIPGERR